MVVLAIVPVILILITGDTDTHGKCRLDEYPNFRLSISQMLKLYDLVLLYFLHVYYTYCIIDTSMFISVGSVLLRGWLEWSAV